VPTTLVITFLLERRASRHSRSQASGVRVSPSATWISVSSFSRTALIHTCGPRPGHFQYCYSMSPSDRSRTQLRVDVVLRFVEMPGENVYLNRKEPAL
jgi:hypothetical protein